jgi:hypothetical protein
MKKDWKLLAVGIPTAIIMSPVMLAGVVYQSVAAYFVAGREIGSALYQEMIKKLEPK